MFDVSASVDSGEVLGSDSAELSGCGAAVGDGLGDTAGVGDEVGVGAGWLLFVEDEQADSTKSRHIISKLIRFKSLPPGFHLCFLLSCCGRAESFPDNSLQLRTAP